MPQFRSQICKYAPLSQQERDYLIELYLDKDMSARQIADKFNIAVRTIYSRLKEHKISKEPRHWSDGKLKFCPTCGKRE